MNLSTDSPLTQPRTQALLKDFDFDYCILYFVKSYIVIGLSCIILFMKITKA